MAKCVSLLQLKSTQFSLLPVSSHNKIGRKRMLSDKKDVNDIIHVKKDKGEAKLDFTNFEQAFRAKTTAEIIKALIVYKLCSVDFLVNRNKEVCLSFMLVKNII